MLPVALLLSAILSAAPDTLDASRVSGVRQGRESLDSGAPMMVVGTAELERSGARELSEVLRTLPGLNVRDYGGVGGLKTVWVRGLGAAHTAVCTDGFLLQDIQQGGIDLSAFDLDDTGSIRMEIGTADDIFRPAGTWAAGSVLSIAPKAIDPGETGLKASAGMGWGSFNTVKPRIRLDGRIAPGWNAAAHASWLHTSGDYPFGGARTLTGSGVSDDGTLRREGSDASILKAGLRLEGNTRRGGRLTGSAAWASSQRGLPGAVIFYTQNPTERLWGRDLQLRSAYERSAGPWRLRAGAGFRQYRTRYTNSDASYPEPLDDRYLQRQLSAGAILQRTLSLGGSGRELALALAQDLSLGSLEAGVLTCPDPQRLSSVSALSAQYRSQRLRLTAGVSASYIHERSAKASQAVETAPDRSRLSPSLSLSFLAAKGLRLRAFVKDGFRVPTFNDLYYDHFGTIRLVPEKALQTGAGATWQLNLGRSFLAFTADTYYNRVRDKIVAVPTLYVWRMHNLGRVDLKGLDCSVQAALPLGGDWSFRARAGWSLLDARDLSDPDAKNYRHQIQYTPRHSGSSSASVARKGLSFSYTLCAVGRRWFLPQNIAENELPAYWDHGIAARKEFRLRRALLTLAAEALNLTGVNYEIVHSYPMPGRQFRLTASITI